MDTYDIIFLINEVKKLTNIYFSLLVYSSVQWNMKFICLLFFFFFWGGGMEGFSILSEIRVNLYTLISA